MKVFISADIEGINGITSWNETELNQTGYVASQRQMTSEVKMAAKAAFDAGAKDIIIKDAHDSALNLIHSELPEYTTLIRGWHGGIASMMGGLDESFDAVIYIGYHSPSRSNGNTLSHTMNTNIIHVKINGKIASEFMINSLYAAYVNVPIAFLSGDLNMTTLAKEDIPNITTVATKEGFYGASKSQHPAKTNKLIYDNVFNTLSKGLYKDNLYPQATKYEIEIQYRRHQDAHSRSYFPNASLIADDIVIYKGDNLYDTLVALKFLL